MTTADEGPRSPSPGGGLSRDERALIEAELVLAERAADALRHASERSAILRQGVGEGLAMQQEVGETREGDLPSVMGQLHVLRSSAAALDSRALPNPEEPYFAHLSIAFGARVRDVLVGYRAFIDVERRVTIVDWQTSPMADVFYSYREGEAFEEELPSGVVEGVILKRHVVSFDSEGRLSRVVTPSASYWRGEDGEWMREDEAAERRPSSSKGLGTGEAEGTEAGPSVTALLDRDQHALLQLSGDRPLLILGGAGSGKTTVAVHRIAKLAATEPDRFAPAETIVIVPTVGLSRLMKVLLEQLGVGDVEVATFDQWVTRQARSVFRSVARRRTWHDAPPRVVSLKRHPALLDVMQRFASSRRSSAPKGRRAASIWLDLVKLIGDEKWLEEAVSSSQGELHTSCIEETCLHLRRQLAPTAEVEYAHVDADRLRALDGRPLDEGTPDEVAGTIDVEDYALLFELLWSTTGRSKGDGGRLATYQHVVIDEAQELAPVELKLLSRAVRRGGTLTVAGDEAQQVDTTAAFSSWDLTLSHLGLDHTDTVRLTTSYRCTREIVSFAWDVLGPVATAPMPPTTRPGVPVTTRGFSGDGQRGLWLLEAVSEVVDREPKARVAVIARGREMAESIAKVLSSVVDARLVLDGRFSLRAGVDVTEVSQVKGLEFDYVIVPDASVERYDDSPSSRRELFVAATRAIHQLVVCWVGSPSPIVPPQSEG